MLTISLWPYAAISTSLAAWVVLLAFQQRSNFFSAAVYLSKSNACMLVSLCIPPRSVCLCSRIIAALDSVELWSLPGVGRWQGLSKDLLRSSASD